MAARSSSRNSSSTTGSSANSSSGDVSAGDETAATSSLKTITTNADSCMWYADSHCSKPRSCFDCLNVAIPSGEVSYTNCVLCVHECHTDCVYVYHVR